MNKEKILIGATSDYDSFCDGFGHSRPFANYISGLVLETAIIGSKYNHRGSKELDHIIAFDRAEVAGTNIGQINMITVSSFCGPCGLIWGYDIAKHPDTHKEKLFFVHESGQKNRRIAVYSAKPLKEALFKLFGSVKNKNFPLLSGAHVPCAGKKIILEGPIHIYAAIALGIPKNRDNDACLFMEDAGTIIYSQEKQISKIKNEIKINIAQSILEVGKNQNIEYKEIFVDMVDAIAGNDQVGCALVVAPYFTIAPNAIPRGDVKFLISKDLNWWEKEIRILKKEE